MINKYERLKENLETIGYGWMKCFGNSMLPILDNPSNCFYIKLAEYEVGDIVFCKVNGRYIDAHKITKKFDGKYMISNNHGHENGWTSSVYGKVTKAINNHKFLKEFD